MVTDLILIGAVVIEAEIPCF